MCEDLFVKLQRMIEDYRKALDGIGMASYEKKAIPKTPETKEELLKALQVIFESSKELNYVLEESPNSIFISDGNGVCLRVNKAYEKMVNMKKDEVLGKNVEELDRRGVFRPSVSLLALRERQAVSVMQDIGDVKDMAVTGVPVFNERGELFRTVTNAVKVDEIEPLLNYVREKESPEPKTRRKELIAASQAMKEILNLADMVKNTESSVLITGETGVGKGVLAAYIHETSDRNKHRMVSINCGAIPENLLESELFGYESGAFTGADKNGKQGLIELSDQGTLFLDEISELPLMLQVKILHFLQTKKLTRVGGREEISINTRIIAATNKSLEEEVERGTFRLDLYYRLNVIPIHIPPLRERKEDIREITKTFLKDYMEKYNKTIPFDRHRMDAIVDYEWQGNVRELENYIERMVLTGESGMFAPARGPGRLPCEAKKAAGGGGPINETVEEVEKELVIAAWEKYRSSYKVAEALGVSQSTAYRRIKKYVKESHK